MTAYYGCGEETCGFTPSDGRLTDGVEYELIADFGAVRIPTGKYVCNGKVTACRQRDLPDAPMGADTARRFSEGTLLLALPAKELWVVEWDGMLWWIAGEDYRFDRKGETEVPLWVYTTQQELLPEEQIELREWYDDRSFLFEETEVTDRMDCGAYRVAAIPQEAGYPAAFYKTGTYIAGYWRSEAHFRPAAL